MRKHNPADNGVHLPFEDVDFINAWQEWLAYRSERKLARYIPRGLKQTFTKLKNDSGNDPKVAVEMINYAIASNWQGIHPLKTTGNGATIQQAAGSKNATRESVNDLYSKRFGTGR